MSSPAATWKARKSFHILVYCLSVAGLKPEANLAAAEVASWAAPGGTSEMYEEMCNMEVGTTIFIYIFSFNNVRSKCV